MTAGLFEQQEVRKFGAWVALTVNVHYAAIQAAKTM